MSFLPTDRVMLQALRTSKIRGVQLAIVVDNKDGEVNPGYRVKVKFPWLNEQETSFWARIAVPMGGPGRGTYVLPEIEDQVLVVFEHGDINRPIVIGGLWSKKQEPVEVNQSGKNNTKLIKSRAGHRIIFDDKEGAEKITIVDKTKKNKIILDSVNKIVKIESDGDIEVLAKTSIILHSNALKVGTKEGVTGKGQSLLVHAQKTFGLKASNGITIGGGNTTINTSNSAATSVSGSGAGELGAPGPELPKDQVEAKNPGGNAGGGGVSSGTSGGGTSSGGGGGGGSGSAGSGGGPQGGGSTLVAKSLGSLTVKVVDGTGTAVSGASVMANGADGTSHSDTTDASGQVTFANVEEGDYDVGATHPDHEPASKQFHVTALASNAVTVALPPVQITLEIEQISFSANHIVERDTLGTFASPEWVAGRAVADQAPICYTRSAPIGLSARFRVTSKPSRAVSVQVRGQATAGAQTLEWTATVSVSPADTQTSITAASSVGLPNTVACYDPLAITWTTTSLGINARSAGSSAHLCYAVLAAPIGTKYWTLLDISCRAAHGESTDSGFISTSFTPFQGRNLTRKRDGHALTYWNPNTTTCTNTAALLARADGSGQCGSWAEFLIDMFKLHGITSGQKILIVRTLAAWTSASIGFLVKNWKFDVPPATSPTAFTHDSSNCHDQTGIPGQGNPDPPGGFYNHFIVRIDGKFLDPSYGAGPFATHAAWEAAAIDGLFQNTSPDYGFHGSATTLLEFRDAATTALI